MNGQWSIRIPALCALLTLACNAAPDPGPMTGTLEVQVTVTGLATDTVVHAVVVSGAGQATFPPPSIPYAGGTVLVPDLPAGTHTVRLESPAASCWVIDENPRAVAIMGGQISRVHFAVSCFGQPATVLSRTTPHSQALELSVGSLSERLVLEPGGTFRLQFLSSKYGFGEYDGTYSHEGPAFHFSFADNPADWQASGTQLGQCLAVSYSLNMGLADFEDGEYCPGSSEPSERTSGTLEVSVTVTGTPTDSATHTVVVTVAGQDLPRQPVPYSGGSIIIPDLPAGTHAVRLESPAATCMGMSSNPHLVTVLGWQTSRTAFTVSCFGPPAIVVNRRGASNERLVLDPAGTFRLQFMSARFGFFEYLGRYSKERAELHLLFDANDGTWTATAALSQQCLAVDYNRMMELDDFVDGDYCAETSLASGG